MKVIDKTQALASDWCLQLMSAKPIQNPEQ